MEINFVAILLAAFSNFMIGGIWYGPLFEKPWLQLNNLSTDDLKKSNQAKLFGGAFLLALISATLLEMFIGKDAELGFALFASASVGFGWVACTTGITYLFERKPLKLFLINAGYHAVAFMVMGLILGILK